MAAFKQILREIFSDGSTGVLSSKRVIGGISMAVVLICTCYLVIRDGSTDVVEDLLMTIFITSASLLGLPAIAGAWGKAKVHIGNVEPIKQETQTPEPIQEQEHIQEQEYIQEQEHIQEPEQTNIPDCDNCYYKNKVQKKSE